MVPATSERTRPARSLEYLEVPHHRLAGRWEHELCREPCAKLKQCLRPSPDELVEDRRVASANALKTRLGHAK
jgi:hypothetical protein